MVLEVSLLLPLYLFTSKINLDTHAGMTSPRLSNSGERIEERYLFLQNEVQNELGTTLLVKSLCAKYNRLLRSKT